MQIITKEGKVIECKERLHATYAKNGTVRVLWRSHPYVKPTVIRAEDLDGDFFKNIQ